MKVTAKTTVPHFRPIVVTITLEDYGDYMAFTALMGNNLCVPEFLVKRGNVEEDFQRPMGALMLAAYDAATAAAP